MCNCIVVPPGDERGTTVLESRDRRHDAPGLAGSQLLGELHHDADSERVEVWLRRRGDGSPELELVQFLWGSGVGWYVHKSLVLDSQQAGALHALVGPVASEPAPALAPSARPRRSLPPVEREGNVIRLKFG